MSRGRRPLARAVALVALTAAFAGSTAVFNSTYHQQAEVDARLTNGADVTVVGGTNPARLKTVPGVKSIEPMQHRYAYVGADLQDLYGVRPQTMLSAGRLQNAWFQGGTAASLMSTLQKRPDAVLVAAETAKDFQLQPGDQLHLRLLDSRTKQFKMVTFHYAGVAKEFPTAPTDSFLVANAGYVASQTGDPTFEDQLIQTDGTSPKTVAQNVRAVAGPGAKITDIAEQRRVVGSNLTAVELSGLTRVELGFALILAIAATGLALGLGFNERRRTFAIAVALGARQRQLGGFVWGESVFVTGAGLLLGAAIASGISVLLVKVLTGVFDPPPDTLAIPYGYLAAAVAAALAATVAAGALTLRGLRRPAIEELRDL
jgi:putative ABC transport system permease protein